jgi:integrase
VYLRRASSKNKQPYVIVLIPELAAIVERRWEARTVTRADGSTFLADHVFHRDGAPVGDFRKAWATAGGRAGFPELHFHDLRRSAARNIDKSGVGQLVGMQITGHETPSMYKRYRIVDEEDIELALAKTQAYVEQQQAVAPKVVALAR